MSNTEAGQLQALRMQQIEEMKAALTATNELQEIVRSGDLSSYEGDDLEERLSYYRDLFLEYDEDISGDIDIMELKRAMEKLGQSKTHLELKKMIAEFDTNNSGTIHYKEFIHKIFGKNKGILGLILYFEEKNNLHRN